jgi:hypothetical protein
VPTLAVDPGRSSVAPGEHVGEAAVGDRAEQRLAGQLCPARRRARDPAEEPRALPRRPEGLGVRGHERLECVPIDDLFERRRRRGLRKLLGCAGEAEAAMAARLLAQLTEVADELVDLAAVMGDERDDLPNPVSLGPLAAVEALDEAVEQLVP